jgi:sugar/nucleoside kinase (ribokinase family)
MCSLDGRVFVLRRTVKLAIGNTMGAGDVFGGWFLARLLESARDTIFELNHVKESVLAGMAAAAWKIQDHSMEVRIPDQQDVVEMQSVLFPAVDDLLGKSSR